MENCEQNNNNQNGFRLLQLLCFGIVSFLPLLMMIYYECFWNMIKNLCNQFDISIISQYWGLLILLLAVILAVIVMIVSLKDIETCDEKPCTIKQIENVNNEALVYMLTYILPLIELDNTAHPFPMIVLMVVIIFISCQSSMIAVNPIMAMFYKICKVQYQCDGSNVRTAVVISKQQINEDDTVKMIRIANNVYYAVKIMQESSE